MWGSEAWSLNACLQRVLTDEERTRQRERVAEAEQERKERHLTRLDQAPQPRKGALRAWPPLLPPCG
jgi:hypothetical protein